MKIKTIVVCLPVRDLGKTFSFYKNVLGISDVEEYEGMILLELPHLSLFLMEKDSFETYSKKAGREAQFPEKSAGAVISCAMETKGAVDSILKNAPKYGGSVPSKAEIDDISGGYTGYFLDPDGHLWELVYPKEK